MARYRHAIEWLAANDDNEWLRDPFDAGSVVMSVAACLVSDVFGRPERQVQEDLLKALQNLYPRSWEGVSLPPK